MSPSVPPLPRQETDMKLTTIALTSVLAVTSSRAFARETGGAGAGAGGTSGAAATGVAGSSSVGSSTGATTDHRMVPISGFSTGTYPTLTTTGHAVTSAGAGNGNKPLLQSARSAESTTPPRRSMIARRRWLVTEAPEIPSAQTGSQ
jgi:hypothetical protein